MKKSLLIVASLALGTAAIAQDNPAGAGAPATTPAGPESQSASPPSGSDPATSTSPGQSSDVTSPSPGAANPSSGASSDVTTGGGSSGGNMAAAQQAASSTDTSNYPKCSRGMTDKCVQAGGSGHAMHRTAHRPHHHK